MEIAEILDFNTITRIFMMDRIGGFGGNFERDIKFWLNGQDWERWGVVYCVGGLLEKRWVEAEMEATADRR